MDVHFARTTVLLHNSELRTKQCRTSANTKYTHTDSFNSHYYHTKEGRMLISSTEAAEITTNSKELSFFISLHFFSIFSLVWVCVCVCEKY